MKHLTLLFFISSCILTFAQDSLTFKTEETALRNRNITLDFGFSDFNTSATPNTATKLLSNRSFNGYFFQRLNPSAKHIEFRIGVGISCENYSFKKDVVVSPLSNSTTFDLGNSIGNDSINFKKSKLSLNHFDIPLEVVFQSKNKTGALKLILGTRIGWVFDAHTKRVIDIHGSILKEKTKADINLNKLRYGVSARLMFKGINLFYFQSLSPLFKNNKGPEITTCTGGISISIQ